MILVILFLSVLAISAILAILNS